VLRVSAQYIIDLLLDDGILLKLSMCIISSKRRECNPHMYQTHTKNC